MTPEPDRGVAEPGDARGRLALQKQGTGEPLLLLHGIGSSGRVWAPVLPMLAERYQVITVDLPGFGASPLLPEGSTPDARELALAVAGALDRLGLESVHVAGNSLGGWVGLELARLGRVRTLTLLCPAGLWRDGIPLSAWLILRGSRWLTRLGGGFLVPVLRYAAARAVLLALIYARGRQLPGSEAIAAARALADGPGFMPTWNALRDSRFTGGSGIEVPVLAAFGDRDHVLPPRTISLAELPPQTRVRRLPGCGHVPMPDAPRLVAGVIRDGVEGAQHRPG